jgi:hypothetical protein
VAPYNAGAYLKQPASDGNIFLNKHSEFLWALRGIETVYLVTIRPSLIPNGLCCLLPAGVVPVPAVRHGLDGARGVPGIAAGQQGARQSVPARSEGRGPRLVAAIGERIFMGLTHIAVAWGINLDNDDFSPEHIKEFQILISAVHVAHLTAKMISQRWAVIARITLVSSLT